jgi:putative transposase
VSRTRLAPNVATGPNQRWSLDFTSDQLADGRGFRNLNIADGSHEKR